MLSNVCNNAGFIHIFLALFLAVNSHVLRQVAPLLVLWHFNFWMQMAPLLVHHRPLQVVLLNHLELLRISKGLVACPHP